MSTEFTSKQYPGHHIHARDLVHTYEWNDAPGPGLVAFHSKEAMIGSQRPSKDHENNSLLRAVRE